MAGTLQPGTIARTTGLSIFGTDAAGYHAARLDYPAALYDLICDHIGRREVPAIAEIGAGTGLATQHMLPMATKRYVIIEPDTMLADHLQAQFATPIVEIINADFVSAPIDGSFDLIAAASVFHWLEPEAALARMRHLLRPGGSVALWWNAYRNPDIGDPFADATMPLLRDLALPPSESAAGHYSLDRDLHLARLEQAGFTDIEHQVFRRERRLTATDAQALYSSYSFVRALPSDRRSALLAAIATLVNDHFAGSAPNVVLTAAYIARRLAV